MQVKKRVLVLVFLVLITAILSSCGNKSAYNVVFKDYDDTILKEENVIHGKNATPPEEPTREGYDFVGWDQKFTKVQSNLTITAIYEVKTHKIIWKSHQGDVLKEDNVIHGKSATPPEEPTREGHDFIGWNQNFDVVKTDLIIMPIYKIHTYTIVWKNYDGSILKQDNDVSWGTTPVYNGIEPKKAESGITVYVFNGWTPNIGTVSGPAEYVAQFKESIKTYEVLWKNYDGSVMKSEEVAHGETPVFNEKAPVKPQTEKYTYTFTGWSPSVDVIDGPREYIAQYEESVNQYKVVFKDIDDFILKEEMVFYGEDATPPKEPTREGYDFVGWDQEYTEVKQELTIKALYDVHTFKLTFNVDGGEQIEPLTKDYNTLIVLPNPTKENYEFTGWLLKEKIIDQLYLKEDTEIVATWQGEIRKISFSSDGGNEIEKITVRYGEIIKTLPSPTKEDYIFQGWVLNDKRVSLPFTFLESKDIILVAEWVEPIANFEYEIVNEEVKILRYIGNQENVVVPNKIEGFLVTSIGSYAFDEANNLKTVIFEEGSELTGIGDYAFYGASSLESIVIPNSVTSIGDGAFWGASSLESIVIPNSVTSIGRSAFYRANNLKTVIFEEGSELTSIGDGAFGGASSLESIVIPNSVTSIGGSAFSGANNLKTVIFEEGSELTIIRISTFWGASSLESIVIPNSVTSIGRSAFYRANNLKTVIFEEGSELTSIGDSAFRGASSLESIVIPNSVTSIGYSAFSEAYKLIIYTSLSERPTGWMSSWNPSNRPVVWSYQETINHDFVSYALLTNGNAVVLGLVDEPTITDIVILKNINDHTVTEILGEAFEGENITSIVIPNSVTSIGDSAFDEANNLKTVIFEEGSELTSIGDSAFDEASSLESIVIPNSVTSIGDYAFFGARSLESIVIPNSVTSIGDAAFSRAYNLKTVIFEEGSELTSIGREAFSEARSLESIVIPNSVTSIGTNAFSVADNLKTVIFEEGSELTSIGNGAFWGASSLESIVIPNSVTSIGDSAFRGANKLIIYTSLSERPTGWMSSWNPSNRPVVWSYQETINHDFVSYALLTNGNAVVLGLVDEPTITDIVILKK